MEWKRVFSQKSRIVIVFGLMVFQLFFFLYSQNSSKALESSKAEVIDCKIKILNSYAGENKKRLMDKLEKKREKVEKKMFKIDKTVQEIDTYGYSEDIFYEALEELCKQVAYINRFQQEVEVVSKQADSMSGISIFKKQNSFSQRNLEKTAQDYERLQEVEPVLFLGDFLEDILSFAPLPFVLLFCGILYAITMVEHKRIGLCSLLFSTEKGRGRLVFSRMWTIAIFTGITTVIIYGIDLFVSMLLYSSEKGFLWLWYPVQSLQMFSALPWKVSIGEFLIVYVLWQWLSVYLISIFFWCIFTAFDNLLLAFGGIAFFLGIEYITYRFVDSSSPANYFKYINICYVLKGTEMFSEYRNLSIVSYAIEKNVCLAIIAIAFLIIFGIIGGLLGKYKYPISSSEKRGKKFKKLRHIICNKYNSYMERASLMGIEKNKILICQKGVWVLIVLCLLGLYNTDFTNIQLSGVQERVINFQEKYEGVPGNASEKELTKLAKRMEKVGKEYQRATQQYESGNLDEKKYMYASIKYDSFAEDQEVLTQLQEQTEYLRNLKKTRNIDGWYIKTQGYNYLFDTKTEKNMNVLLYSFGVVLLCSGIFAFEKKSGMKELLRSTQKGRNILFQKKMKNMFGIVMCVFLIMTILELTNVTVLYGLSGFSAPIQSISMLYFFPFSCSIGTFFVWFYLSRFVMLLVVASFTSLLSILFTQKTAISLSIILYIPSLLYLAGISVLEVFSITNVLGIISLLLTSKSIWMTEFVCLGFAMVGLGSIFFSYKKWSIGQVFTKRRDK